MNNYSLGIDYIPTTAIAYRVLLNVLFFDYELKLHHYKIQIKSSPFN